MAKKIYSHQIGSGPNRYNIVCNDPSNNQQNSYSDADIIGKYRVGKPDGVDLDETRYDQEIANGADPTRRVKQIVKAFKAGNTAPYES